MEIIELQTQHVLDILIADTPKAYWDDLATRSRVTYAESFAAVAADRFLNDEQRLSKLFQERHFKMEHLFKQVGIDNGVPVSPSLIHINRCYYTYAKRGRFSATQKYVARPDDMPKPAKFRVQLAAAARFHRASRFDLGDVQPELLTPPEVGGIFLHGPIGSTFVERDQRVGFSWFCVPYADFSGWAVKLSLAEIIAGYQAGMPERADKVIPKLRVLPPAEGGTE
jgi:hypothetical protein